MAASSPSKTTASRGVFPSRSGGSLLSLGSLLGVTEEDSLAPIREQLEQEGRELQGKADSLRSGLALVEESLGRIRSALAALNGCLPSGAAESGAPDKKQRKAAAPAANRDQVMGFINEELAITEPVPVEALKGRVEKRLAERGFSRLGFAMRFKEALADERLIDADGGISRR